MSSRSGTFYEVLELSMGIWTPDEQRECEAWYRQSGRVKSVHGAFIDNNPVSANPGVREASVRACLESCALAQRIGAENIVFHCSCFPFLRGAYLENWASQSAAFYTALAEEFRLNIFIENSYDLDPTPLAELMARIPRNEDSKAEKSEPGILQAEDSQPGMSHSGVLKPRIGVCLDIGHANLSRVPVPEWFEALGDRIEYLHLSDNLGDFDNHMALGEGKMDWEQVLPYIRRMSPDTPMTLEVGGLPEIRRSLEFLRENGIT